MIDNKKLGVSNKFGGVYYLLEKLKEKPISSYEHSLRVSNLCELFGQKIGLSEEEIEKLKLGALLHDIGKLQIPNSILEKPSRLTSEEYSTIKKHPIYGYNLLIQAGVSDKDVLDMVLQHHERIDGLGYPYGLANDSISNLTRILTICDSYDAMSSKRAYKNEYSLDYIKSELKEYAGSQFDYEYANMFLSYLNEESIKKDKLK